MKQLLKIGIQQHLDEKSLSSQQLKQLLDLQKQYNPKKNSLNFSWYRGVSVASILVLTMISVYFMNTATFSTQTIEQKIAAEVAKNHLKLKPLEFNFHSMQNIGHYFKQLDFLPASPSFIKLTENDLLGGRYCSIQGITAVQLRLKNNKTNKVQSLYQAEYNKQVFKGFPTLKAGDKPLTLFVNGMKVDMWVEKDILFALTE